MARQPSLVKPFHQDPRLCPVYHLARLEKILKKLRHKTEPRFWLSSETFHKAISPSIMCGWLKEVITASGSMAGMARDVSSVGASTAVQTGNWKRLSTMQKHYFKQQSLRSMSNILKVTG